MVACDLTIYVIALPCAQHEIISQEVLKRPAHKSPFVFEGFLCGKTVVEILLSM